MLNCGNVEEEPSTTALIKGDVSRVKGQFDGSSVNGEFTDDVSEDEELWRRPWTTEAMENLAITMQDFEVLELEPAPVVFASLEV